MQSTLKVTSLVKPLGYGPVMLAHYFQGEEEEEDLQDMLERLTLCGHDLKVLSVDIVFSETLGNLGGQEVFSKFRAAIAARILVARVPAPMRVVVNGGPQILRTEEHLKGLLSLQYREIGQVMTDNLLL